MAKLLLLLECLLCKNKFTVDAVPSHQYYLETGICRACYLKGQKQNSRVWCFGKKPKRGSPGYSEENIHCRSLCPDRRICRQFVNKQTNKEK